MYRRNPPRTTAGRNWMRSLRSLKKDPVRIVAPKHLHSGQVSAGRKGSRLFFSSGVAKSSTYELIRASSLSIDTSSSCSNLGALLLARYAGGSGSRSSRSSCSFSSPSFRNGVTHVYSSLPITPCSLRPLNWTLACPPPGLPTGDGLDARVSSASATRLYSLTPKDRNTLSVTPMSDIPSLAPRAPQRMKAAGAAVRESSIFAQINATP